MKKPGFALPAPVISIVHFLARVRAQLQRVSLNRGSKQKTRARAQKRSRWHVIPRELSVARRSGSRVGTDRICITRWKRDRRKKQRQEEDDSERDKRRTRQAAPSEVKRCCCKRTRSFNAKPKEKSGKEKEGGRGARQSPPPLRRAKRATWRA